MFQEKPEFKKITGVQLNILALDTLKSKPVVLKMLNVTVVKYFI